MFAVTLLFSIHNYRRTLHRCQPPKTQSPSSKTVVSNTKPRARDDCVVGGDPSKAPAPVHLGWTSLIIATDDEQPMKGVANDGKGEAVALRAPQSQDNGVPE
jgi:hypothetical protein